MQGKWIKKIREELVLSQVEFAKLLGVTRTTVSNWETGTCYISKENKEKILNLIKKR